MYVCLLPVYHKHSEIHLLLNKTSLDKNSEAPTTSISQVSKTQHRRVPCKRASPSRLTEYQLCELKKRFKSDACIKGVEKELLAKSFGITQSAARNWSYT